jgi:hypothetical protein
MKVLKKVRDRLSAFSSTFSFYMEQRNCKLATFVCKVFQIFESFDELAYSSHLSVDTDSPQSVCYDIVYNIWTVV